MEYSLVETLEHAKNSLTPENWRKGAYFKVENNIICMCAHGAVQALVNPECKKALDEGTIDIPPYRARAATVAAALARVGCKSAKDIWDTRSATTRKNYSNRDKNYGNLNAHYLLGMVGLTIWFNDNKDTTLEMVKQKFDEAIELAKQLNV